MALDLFRTRLGISLDDEANVLHGVTAPNIAPGVSAPEGSLYLQSNGTTSGTWFKNGADDTSWLKLSSSLEAGYQNAFMGKSAEGNVLPDYTSVNYVTDGQALSDAVSALDAGLGAKNAAGHYITGATANGDIAALDTQVFANTSAIASLLTNIKWRESVYAITADTFTAGQTAPTTFTDDESAGIGAPAEGSFIISSTQNAIYKVVSGKLEAQALQDGFTYIVAHTLVNSPASQEKQSMWSYSGTSFVKIADVNWQLANGINLSSGYTSPLAASARPIAGDTVEGAIAKLDSRIGASVTDGNAILATKTANENLQAIDTALITLPVRTKLVSAVHTSAVLDSVDVSTVEAVKWNVVAKVGNRRYACEILATSDGQTDGAVDYTEYAQLFVRPKIAGLTFSVVVSGNNMQLLVTSTEACAVGALRQVIDADFI